MLSQDEVVGKVLRIPEVVGVAWLVISVSRQRGCNIQEIYSGRSFNQTWPSLMHHIERGHLVVSHEEPA
jgi:hypothetical protein